MPWAPTTEQLLDLDGVARRTDSYRFELLDRDEEIIGELHPILDDPPTITFATDADVNRTLSGMHLVPSEAGDVNPLSDRVRPVMMLQNGAEYPLGVFLWGDNPRPVRPWGSELAADLVDKMNILNQGIRSTIGFNKGADVGLAVIAVALLYFTLDEIDADPISADLGVGTTWSIGTSGRQVLADLLGGVGFLPPHFARNGRLRLRDTPDLSTTNPALVYEAGGRIIADSILDADDQLDAPNLFKVYDTSGQAPIVGTYEVPSSAPHSFANRGFYVVDAVGQQGLKTVARANKAAKARATTSGRPFRTWQFASTADPRHDAWEPTTILGNVGMETRWSMPLFSGAKMTHAVQAVF